MKRFISLMISIALLVSMFSYIGVGTASAHTITPSIDMANCYNNPQGFTGVYGHDYDGNQQEVCFANAGTYEGGNILYNVYEIYSGNNTGHILCDTISGIRAYYFSTRFQWYSVSGCYTMVGITIN
ncbi:hypothetical protein [Dictyobacter kobayashii]|uniref:Uncharacterized protein n=1 Tax=Dictyobacter kobayashii TaxID=2014872 RepID=A0A402ASZ1_9CHLR|nr:hypothetical protein [Dictyobacter kobayashii]GCE22217.1 hypothetical protein KDK_60170 [Dictyobacter kobayashii]